MSWGDAWGGAWSATWGTQAQNATAPSAAGGYHFAPTVPAAERGAPVRPDDEAVLLHLLT